MPLLVSPQVPATNKFGGVYFGYAQKDLTLPGSQEMEFWRGNRLGLRGLECEVLRLQVSASALQVPVSWLGATCFASCKLCSGVHVLFQGVGL